VKYRQYDKQFSTDTKVDDERKTLNAYTPNTRHHFPELLWRRACPMQRTLDFHLEVVAEA
jgi:hypothetical protein